MSDVQPEAETPAEETAPAEEAEPLRDRETGALLDPPAEPASTEPQVAATQPEAAEGVPSPVETAASVAADPEPTPEPEATPDPKASLKEELLGIVNKLQELLS